MVNWAKFVICIVALQFLCHHHTVVVSTIVEEEHRGRDHDMTTEQLLRHRHRAPSSEAVDREEVDASSSTVDNKKRRILWSSIFKRFRSSSSSHQQDNVDDSNKPRGSAAADKVGRGKGGKGWKGMQKGMSSKKKKQHYTSASKDKIESCPTANPTTAIADEIEVSPTAKPTPLTSPPTPSPTLVQDLPSPSPTEDCSGDEVCNENCSILNPDPDCQVIVGPKCSLSSDFEGGDEGWTINGEDNQGGSADPGYQISGGNPGGHIFATGNKDGVGVWYFQAPTKFHGDFEGAYGTSFSFDLQQSSSTSSTIPSPDDELEVVIKSSDSLIRHTTGSNLSTTWNSYSIVLEEAAGWLLGNDTTPAIESEIRAVLSDIVDIQIRGDYSLAEADDTVVLRLDTVSIESTLAKDICGVCDGPGCGPNAICPAGDCIEELSGFITVIAAIDESNDQQTPSSIARLWEAFSGASTPYTNNTDGNYPNRRFCLLQPIIGPDVEYPGTNFSSYPVSGTVGTSSYDGGLLYVPESFFTGGYKKGDIIDIGGTSLTAPADQYIYSPVNRDNQGVDPTSDWGEICGLNAVKAVTGVGTYALFIDISGSMFFNTVSGSVAQLNQQTDITQLFGLSNKAEDWISPFNRVLPIPCTSSAQCPDAPRATKSCDASFCSYTAIN